FIPAPFGFMTDDFGFVLEQLHKGSVPKSATLEMLSELAQGKHVNVDQYKVVSTDALEDDIRVLIQKEKGASLNALMGMIMAKYKGRADGKKVMDLLKKYHS
ncbi:MAG: hypothetical protein AABX72_03510, partial [Nanoarchaeota archaeon]